MKSSRQSFDRFVFFDRMNQQRNGQSKIHERKKKDRIGTVRGKNCQRSNNTSRIDFDSEDDLSCHQNARRH